MSDSFDHEAEAYEDFCFNADRYAEGYAVPGYGRRKPYGGRPSFNYDPNYYHSTYHFIKLVQETEKSYCFKLAEGEGDLPSLVVWVPKSICRKLTDTTVLAHQNIYQKCLRKAVEDYKLQNKEALLQRENQRNWK